MAKSKAVGNAYLSDPERGIRVTLMEHSDTDGDYASLVFSGECDTIMLQIIDGDVVLEFSDNEGNNQLHRLT